MTEPPDPCQENAIGRASAAFWSATNNGLMVLDRELEGGGRDMASMRWGYVIFATWEV
jgi:hypothetical protein